MAEYSIELPLPPKELSPNYRSHWATKGAKVTRYRMDVATLLRKAKVPRIEGQIEIDLEFYLCRLKYDIHSYYPKDEDNARSSFKAGQDSLKDVGIVPGDGKKYVRTGKTVLYTTAKEHKGRTCVVMTIRMESK